MGWIGVASRTGKLLGRTAGKWGNPKAESFAERAERLRGQIADLKDAHGVSRAYVMDLLAVARKKDLPTIIQYLKSADAVGISKWDRAVLIHRAIEKLDILNIMSHLL